MVELRLGIIRLHKPLEFGEIAYVFLLIVIFGIHGEQDGAGREILHTYPYSFGDKHPLIRAVEGDYNFLISVREV